MSQAAIEEGCKKLVDSGLFTSVAFQYAPGPRFGYILSLSLTDHASLSYASIDIPGVDEKEVWHWLISRYPRFQYKVSNTGAAQQYLAGQIEQHLGAKLAGPHLVVRLESDLARHDIVASLQPEVLPTITAIDFTGQQEFGGLELAHMIDKLVLHENFTDHRFRMYLELNIRRAYEEHGMFRVQFPNIIVRKTSASTVAVTTVIDEGPKYTLGAVQLVGDNPPVDSLLRAANFRTGYTANGNEIQTGIWEMGGLLKRSGSTAGAATQERIFHDDQGTLDLRISFRRSARALATTGLREGGR